MNILQLESDHRAKVAKAREMHAAALQACAAQPATATTAAVPARLMTAEERAPIDNVLAEAQAIKTQIDSARSQQNLADAIAAFGTPVVSGGNNTPPPTSRHSMGVQLATHPDYIAFIRASAHRRSGNWTSPPFELLATTLDTSSGSGGPLIQPQVLPGIQELFFRKLTIRDLLAPGTTDSNAILYLKEKTFTNAAAAVAEGQPKPESTLVFENATTTVKKLAHWLPVTEEMLEDFSAIRSFIDARLRLGLQLTEEDELLNGSGIGEHLLGIRTNSGLSTDQARGSDTNADAILKQITAITTGALIQPDGIVMNPANWQTLQLMKNAQGNYMGTGPWAGPQTPTLWGLPVVVTPAMAAGVALVGAFRMAAQIFDKGGVRVEVSNSHADFFVKNLIAIRCEERLALAVYRPAGFGEVTGLN